MTFLIIARPFTAVWRSHTSYIVLRVVYLFVLMFFLSGMPLKWTSGTTVPGTAWVRRMRSSRCPFTVCTTIERLTSSGMDFDKKGFYAGIAKNEKLFRKKVFKYAVLIICFEIQLYICVGPMTHACWSHWVKATKNCHSNWKPRRYTLQLSASLGFRNKFTKVSGLFLTYFVFL